MTTPEERSAPRYRLVLPPGFLLIPVRDATDAEIAQQVRSHYRSLPRDSFGPRIDRVAEQLLSIARPARAASVIDLIVPMGVPWRAPISVGTALSIVTPSSADEWDAVEGDRVETEAGLAVRFARRHDAPADPDEIGALLTVQYTWRVPGDERLLTGVYTVSGAGDPELLPLVDALAELSDLILSTMRWDAAGADTDADPDSPGDAAEQTTAADAASRPTEESA